MRYKKNLKYHFATKSGWINDPNGLVEFNGQYHIFYQHTPLYEVPWKQPMHWGHAVTKDFLSYTELPIALYPDMPYDKDGVWSGTAIAKDDVLYLFYASVSKDKDGNGVQNVSMAYSTDGINFIKHPKNPIIPTYPKDGSKDFRDPAVTKIGDDYYLVMASGDVTKNTANLLLYKSIDLVDWQYQGVLAEWENSIYAECPSIMEYNGKVLLSTSVCKKGSHYFSIMIGNFTDGKFIPEIVGEVDKGPDQYAGQIFKDSQGRAILISWSPGWDYSGYANIDVGCMTVPREILVKNGKICAYPVKEVCHLLKDDDKVIEKCKDGFYVNRKNRTPFVYKCNNYDLKVLKDKHILELYLNGGEEVFTILL